MPAVGSKPEFAQRCKSKYSGEYGITSVKASYVDS